MAAQTIRVADERTRCAANRLRIERVENRAKLRVDCRNLNQAVGNPSDINRIGKIQRARMAGENPSALQARLGKNQQLAFDWNVELAKDRPKNLIIRPGEGYVADREALLEPRDSVTGLRSRITDRRLLVIRHILRVNGNASAEKSGEDSGKSNTAGHRKESKG